MPDKSVRQRRGSAHRRRSVRGVGEGEWGEQVGVELWAWRQRGGSGAGRKGQTVDGAEGQLWLGTGQDLDKNEERRKGFIAGNGTQRWSQHSKLRGQSPGTRAANQA